MAHTGDSLDGLMLMTRGSVAGFGRLAATHVLDPGPVRNTMLPTSPLNPPALAPARLLRLQSRPGTNQTNDH